MKVFFIIIIILSLKLAFAQAPEFSMGKINYSGVNDYGTGVAADQLGNVIEVGYTRSIPPLNFNLQGNILVQSPPAAEHGDYATSGYSNQFSDSYVAKYDTEGNLLWYLQSGGGYAEEVGGVVTDSQNNIYVAIFTRSYDAVLGPISLPNPQPPYPVLRKGFIVKLNPNGHHIWTKEIDAEMGSYPTNVGPNGVTIRWINMDSQDNLYVMGSYYAQTLQVEDQTLSGVYDNQLNEDYFMLKLGSDGALNWLSGLKSNGIENFSKFNINDNNVIVISGSSNASTVQVGDFTFINPTDLEYQPHFVFKIDAETGNGIWATSLSIDTGIDLGFDIYTSLNVRESLIDNDGNLYLAGNFSGFNDSFQTLNVSFGSSFITVPYIPDSGMNFYRGSFMFLAKFDSDGERMWLKTSEDLYNYVISLSSIQFDSEGNIVGLGNYIQPTTIENGNLLPNSDCGAETNGCITQNAYKSFITKFDTTLENFVWSRQTGNTFSMNVNFMDLTPSNDIIIGGSIIQGPINFDGTQVEGYPVAGGFYDAFVAKFNNYSLTTGEINSNRNEIYVYPNPVGNLLRINSEYPITAIKIFDMTGRLLMSKTALNLDQINMSQLKPGIYNALIFAENGKTYSKKVIKK